MTQNITIQFKRSEDYYLTDGTTINSKIKNLILEFGEPLYLKDLGYLVIGDAHYYDIDDKLSDITHTGTLKGSTVPELIAAHQYFAIANNTNLYGNAKYQETIDINSKTDDGYTIANTSYVKNYTSNAIDNALAGITDDPTNSPDTSYTVTAFDQVNGRVYITFNPISISYTQINNAKPAVREATSTETVQLPIMDSTATVGTSNNWARADHIHPSDTSKANTASPTLTGDAKYTKDIALTEVSSNPKLIANLDLVNRLLDSKIKELDSTITNEPATSKTLTALNETDGKLSATFNPISISYSQINDAKPATATDTPKMDNQTAAIGTSNNWARADHQHPCDNTKADKISTVSNISYDGSKFTKVINGTSTTVVTNDTLKSSMGLNNVPNESKATMFTSSYFTGTPTAPDINDSSTRSQIATQNYVDAVASKTANTTDIIYVTGINPTDTYKPFYYNTSGSENSDGIRIDCSKGVILGAAWNDFAEYRKCNEKPGTVVCEVGDGSLKISHERLQPGAAIISDTCGMIIGPEGKEFKPVAVAGRVLAKYNGDKSEYKPGMPVCAGIDGKISTMSREESMYYPEAIIGYVSEIPTYKEWNKIKVNDRIWIKIK